MPEIQGRWSGVVHQLSHEMEADCPVVLDIDTVSDAEFAGTMLWPSFGDCRTRVRGAIDGALIKWTETDYLAGDDVVLYGLYVARFGADGEVVGEWMDPSYTIDPRGPDLGVPGASFTLTRTAWAASKPTRDPMVSRRRDSWLLSEP